MKAGITITTYERPTAFLSLVLERVFQHSGGAEVVLMSNSESEEARKSERSLQSQFPFTFLPNKHENLMTLLARDQGMKHLFNSCQYFVGMDDDILVTPNWLERIVSVMESDPSIGVAVPLLPFSPAVWYQAQVVALPNEVTQAMISIAECRDFNTTALDVYWKGTFLNKKSSYRSVSIPEYAVLVRSKKAIEAGLVWPEALGSSIGPGNADLAHRTRKAGLKLVAVKNSFVFHLQTATHITFQNEHPEIAGPMRTMGLQHLEKKYGKVYNVYDEPKKKSMWQSCDGTGKFFEHSNENLKE